MAAAIADFDQVLALTPEDTWALQGRAEAHEALGHNPQAIADYGRLAALRPGDTRWRIKISQLGATPPTPIVPPTIATTHAAARAAVTEHRDQSRHANVAAGAGTGPRRPRTTGQRGPQAPDCVARARLRCRRREWSGRRQDPPGAWTQFAADVGLQPGGEPDQELLAAAEDALRHEREQAAEARRGAEHPGAAGAGRPRLRHRRHRRRDRRPLARGAAGLVEHPRPAGDGDRRAGGGVARRGGRRAADTHRPSRAVARPLRLLRRSR